MQNLLSCGYTNNHSPTMGLLDSPAHLLELREVDGILFCPGIGRLLCPLITPLINVHSKEEPVIYTKCIVLNHCSVILSCSHIRALPTPERENPFSLLWHPELVTIVTYSPFPGLPRQACLIYLHPQTQYNLIFPPSSLCSHIEYLHQHCS